MCALDIKFLLNYLKTIRHDIQLLYTWIEGTVNYYTLQLNIGITSMNKN